jgi:hypothetical protein
MSTAPDLSEGSMSGKQGCTGVSGFPFIMFPEVEHGGGTRWRTGWEIVQKMPGSPDFPWSEESGNERAEKEEREHGYPEYSTHNDRTLPAGSDRVFGNQKKFSRCAATLFRFSVLLQLP